jgi:hypothetical protein
MEVELKSLEIPTTEDEEILGSNQIRDIRTSLRNEYVDLQALSERMKRLEMEAETINK